MNRFVNATFVAFLLSLMAIPPASANYSYNFYEGGIDCHVYDENSSIRCVFWNSEPENFTMHLDFNEDLKVGPHELSSVVINKSFSRNLIPSSIVITSESGRDYGQTIAFVNTTNISGIPQFDCENNQGELICWTHPDDVGHFFNHNSNEYNKLNWFNRFGNTDDLITYHLSSSEVINSYISTPKKVENPDYLLTLIAAFSAIGIFNKRAMVAILVVLLLSQAPHASSFSSEFNEQPELNVIEWRPYAYAFNETECYWTLYGQDNYTQDESLMIHHIARCIVLGEGEVQFKPESVMGHSLLERNWQGVNHSVYTYEFITDSLNHTNPVYYTESGEERTLKLPKIGYAYIDDSDCHKHRNQKSCEVSIAANKGHTIEVIDLHDSSPEYVISEGEIHFDEMPGDVIIRVTTEDGITYEQLIEGYENPEDVPLMLLLHSILIIAAMKVKRHLNNQVSSPQSEAHAGSTDSTLEH